MLAATTTGSSPPRRICAISWSPGRTPARASTTSSGDLGVGDRLARLVLDRDGERVLVVEVHAAGVDQRQPAAVPLGGELLAVARDARALVDDRLARLREAVDERGLADVRVADDRDLHRSSRASTRQRDDLVDHLVEREAGGVERHGVRRGLVDGAVAAGVARVALVLVAADLREVAAALLDAAAGALVRVGGEEDLDRGVGRDHGRDVAALGDPVAVGHDLLLLGDEHLAHARGRPRPARRPWRPRACGSRR